MDPAKRIELFDKKVNELIGSRFSRNLLGSSFKFKWEKDKGFATSMRTGPDYEAIKCFVITFRNFILDGDNISMREMSDMYQELKNDSLNRKFKEIRSRLNNFLNSNTIIRFNQEFIKKRDLIDNYIYGDVIHLEKHDKFYKWISLQPMNDLIFNEIVFVLGHCLSFLLEVNVLNKEVESQLESTV